MTPLVRADLEALLRARRLDRTLTTALPTPAPFDEHAVAAIGLSDVDARLGGGLPRGQLSEIVGGRTSGRTTLLMAALAAAPARGELVAVVDALDMLDVDSAASAGIDLDRLLWVRGHVAPYPGLCRDANQRALEQALRALTRRRRLRSRRGAVRGDSPSAVHHVAAAAADGRGAADRGGPRRAGADGAQFRGAHRAARDGRVPVRQPAVRGDRRGGQCGARGTQVHAGGHDGAAARASTVRGGDGPVKMQRLWHRRQFALGLTRT